MASQSSLETAVIKSVNDFVVKFANVNGSGSASANALFAKSILRMGIPASSRNIFPSNIQGLPTWYEVRISESGHLGRRGGVDMMVAMNPETWDQDLAEIETGRKPGSAAALRQLAAVLQVPAEDLVSSPASEKLSPTAARRRSKPR